MGWRYILVFDAMTSEGLVVDQVRDRLVRCFMMAAQTSEALSEANREEAEQLAGAFGEELSAVSKTLQHSIVALPDELPEGQIHGYRERLLAKCAEDQLRLCTALQELSPAGLEVLMTGGLCMNSKSQ